MRKFYIPAHIKHRYRIFGPTGRHKQWRIKTVLEGKFETIYPLELDAINHAPISEAERKVQVELLVEALYRKDGVQIGREESTNVNYKIADAYLATKSSTKVKTGSKKARRQYVYRAVHAIGDLSLATSPLNELQGALDERYEDGRHRRMVVTLNALLRHLGRTDKLEMRPVSPIDVAYITESQMLTLLEYLPSNAWRLCVQMAFYTGMRIGELFALERHNKRPKAINVDWQIDTSGAKTLPKNGKRRTCSPFAPAMGLFADWLEAKSEISHSERVGAARVVKQAAQLAWPNKQLNLRFHDLRHSYAIAALEHGASLEQVAKQLGNEIEVTERHYVGFVQTSKMEEAMWALLNPEMPK